MGFSIGGALGTIAGGAIGTAIGGPLGGSIGAQVVGGLMGDILGSDDRDAAQAAIKQAMADLESVGMPPDLSKEIILQNFQSAGILTPELEQDLGKVHSELSGYKENVKTLQAQADALSAFKQQARSGLTAEDRLALLDVRNQAQKDAEAKRQQVMQNMQARGLGGSGAELVSQLAAGQEGANLQSRENLNIAAQAQQRALAALGQSASLAGQMRGQDLSTAQATLGAADVANQFNMQNSMARQRANVGTLNQTQQANLANRQDIMNRNVGMSNQEKLRQNQAKRDYWQDTLGYKQALANARLGQASNYQAQADRTANQMYGIGNAVSGGFQAYQNQQNQKDYMDLLKNTYGNKSS